MNEQRNLFGEIEKPQTKTATRRPNIGKSRKEHEDYDAFVDKFKPKLTTDDCYTPRAVYEAVLEWALANCNIPKDARIMRPFIPGGDYQREDYSGNVAVVDNPPFSILSQICYWYAEQGVKFFLFAPSKTILGIAPKVDNLTKLLCLHRETKFLGATIIRV